MKGTTLEQCQCYNGEILEDVRTLLAVFYIAGTETQRSSNEITDQL